MDHDTTTACSSVRMMYGMIIRISYYIYPSVDFIDKLTDNQYADTCKV